MSKSLVNKLVKITWFDHATYSNRGWFSSDKIRALTPCSVVTVGWVLKETKKFIVLVSTMIEDDGHQGEFCILKGTIKKVKILND